MSRDVGDAAWAVGGPLGDERRIFAFESDFAADLRCIPMIVRFKLDRCGIKLSLRQWAKFGAGNRLQLVSQRCDTAREIEYYDQKILQLIETRGGGPVVRLPIDPEPLWADPAHVPRQVVDQAASTGVAVLTQDRWASLSTLERFALLKLARSNHDNDNFAPAMREFGLVG